MIEKLYTIFMNSIYCLNIVVRDYECDSQGIVNNAVYNNYFEHARNVVILREGYTLNTLFQHKQVPVVTRSTVDYTYPLRSGNVCNVITSYEKKGSYKILFHQSIVKICDTPFEENNKNIIASDVLKDANIAQKKYKEEKICAKAVFTIAIVWNQKPLQVKDTIFAKMLKN